MPVGVLAADPLLRSGLVSALRGQPGIRLVEGELHQAGVLVAVTDNIRTPRQEAITERLRKAITDAHQGRGHLPPEQVGQMLQGLARLHRDVLVPHDLTPAGLSSRETTVLRLLAEGRTPPRSRPRWPIGTNREEHPAQAHDQAGRPGLI